jgi:dTDP-4-amino-4,6-dideoxygalactose transaminase
VDTLRSGWLTTGPRTARFEDAFADFVGSEGALALNSGTAALHAALLALGIGPGQAVVVPTMTFASAAHVVEHVGAIPLLCDVEPETLNLDPEAVVRAVTSTEAPVRALLPVHLHGQPCRLDALLDVAEDHEVAIVDDAAHALPARVGERMIGGSGHPRVLTGFSFYATKNLAMGEGGMLTGPANLVEEARRWILHGMTKDAWRRHEDGAAWRYDVDRAGFKYNLSDIQAALGLVQLRRLPSMYGRRREIAARYSRGFADLDEIQTPLQRDGTEHSWHIYAIRLELDRLTISRDRVIDELRERNIGTSVHFIPIHTFSHYRKRYGYVPEQFPIASREFERLVSLPIHSRMTDQDVDDVMTAVEDVVRAHRR